MRLFLWFSNTVALLKVFFLIFWFQKIILKRSRIQLRSPCFFTLLSHNEFLAWRHSCRPQIHQKYNRVIHKYIHLNTKEKHSTPRKSLIQYYERSELRLHFEWTKVNQKCQKWSILASFWKPEACGQTVLPDRSILIVQKLVENAKIQNFKCDI